MTAVCFVSLGSNLGDRAAYINKAITKLRDHQNFTVLMVSKFLETEPQDMLSKNLFINCAVKLKTDIAPKDVLTEFLKIEKELGRQEKGEKKDRTIDLDLLFYDEQILNSDGLIIPHPKIEERYFVLKPLCDIAPEFIHPVLNQTTRQLLNTLTKRNKK